MDKQVTENQRKGIKLRAGCVTCRRPTNHIVAVSVDEALNDKDEYFANESFQIIRCLGCDTFSFRHESTNSEDYDHDGETRIEAHIYPERHRKTPPLHDAMFLPWKVRVIYEETQRALNHDQPILSGIGIRALVESVCHDRNVTGPLASMIDQLVRSNDLKQTEADIFHKLRFMGNQAAHEIEAPSEESLSLAFDIVEHLLVNTYLLERRGEYLPQRRV